MVLITEVVVPYLKERVEETLKQSKYPLLKIF